MTRKHRCESPFFWIWWACQRHMLCHATQQYQQRMPHPSDANAFQTPIQIADLPHKCNTILWHAWCTTAAGVTTLIYAAHRGLKSTAARLIRLTHMRPHLETPFHKREPTALQRDLSSCSTIHCHYSHRRDDAHSRCTPRPGGRSRTPHRRRRRCHCCQLRWRHRTHCSCK